MSNQEQQYLQAMGIQSWDLTHPERLQGYQPLKATLDSGCRLLLVSTTFPTESEILLFERVLKSFHVKLQETQYVSPASLSRLELSTLEWIWYAGCEVISLSGVKTLRTPVLSEVDGNTQYRRDLWQQICSYEAS